MFARMKEATGGKVDEVKVDEELLKAITLSQIPGAGLIEAAYRTFSTVFGDLATPNVDYRPRRRCRSYLED